MPLLQVLTLIERKNFKNHTPLINPSQTPGPQNFPARRRKLKMMRLAERISHILIRTRKVTSLNTLGSQLTHQPGVMKGQG